MIGAAWIGVAAAAPPGAAQEFTDTQIRQRIILQSVTAYPGRCACPYSINRNGRRCGQRSAYRQPGGAAPLCFPDDVTDEMLAAYREQNNSLPDIGAAGGT